MSRESALAVEWRDVTFTYAGELRPALDGLTLSIRAGEKVLVMGPSGCGKSTLGLTLNGIIPRDVPGTLTGEVLVGERAPIDRELAEVAGEVGLVFQDPDAQLCTITVGDEIAFGPQNLLVPADVIRERLAEAAGLVGMTGHLTSDVFQLSGGQKQRVAIASSLVMQPGVIVLDEPTANLDPAGRAEVLRVLTAVLADSAMTTLVVEHHPAELIGLMDRVVVMDAGRVVFDGPPRAVFAEHGTALARLGVRLPAATTYALAVDPSPRSDVPLTVEQLGLPPVGSGESAIAVPDSAPTEGEPLVEFRAVSFAYGAPRSKRKRRAFRADLLADLSFRIDAGEIVAIMGPNGSGKSTTSSLMIGINRPVHGEVLVGGRDARFRSIADLAKDVGYVFQYPEHQFVADTVFDEVAFSLRRLGQDVDIESVARAALERFDLAHLADRNPFRLSLGQKRRLSIAAMAVYRPPVLLLDEPTFGQDQAHTDDLAEVVRDLHAGGTAIVMVTHDLKLTAEVATRVLVVEHGRLAHDGTPTSLLARLDEDGPFAGLMPSDEYSIWRRVRQRAPLVPFTADMTALGTAVREAEEVRA